MLRVPRERTIQRKILSDKINQDIKTHNRRRNELMELLADNGVSRKVLRKSTSTVWLEEKARDLGLEGW